MFSFVPFLNIFIHFSIFRNFWNSFQMLVVPHDTRTCWTRVRRRPGPAEKESRRYRMSEPMSPRGRVGANTGAVEDETAVRQRRVLQKPGAENFKNIFEKEKKDGKYLKTHKTKHFWKIKIWKTI